jgi:hypothetical protein
MLRKTLFMLWLISQVSGFFLTSYGMLRESFADLAQPEGFGKGRAGEGPFGGGLTNTEECLVNFGVRVGLLPSDRSLVVTDRKKNAAWAIAGIILIGCLYLI